MEHDIEKYALVALKDSSRSAVLWVERIRPAFLTFDRIEDAIEAYKLLHDDKAICGAFAKDENGNIGVIEIDWFLNPYNCFIMQSKNQVWKVYRDIKKEHDRLLDEYQDALLSDSNIDTLIDIKFEIAHCEGYLMAMQYVLGL